MQLDHLRRQIHAYVDATDDEAELRKVLDAIKRKEDAPTSTSHSPEGEPYVSFDADGTGYTAKELGDTLDERVRAMRRGEGVLTLEEFTESGKKWRERLL